MRTRRLLGVALVATLAFLMLPGETSQGDALFGVKVRKIPQPPKDCVISVHLRSDPPGYFSC